MAEPSKGRVEMVAENKPLVSLIFPAKNEGNNVKSTLESARKAKTNYPFEMIVVDDGSVDNCCDFIESFDHHGQIKLVRTEGIGLPKAKNLGAEHAKGTYLIFCDAHLFFEDYWIDQLLEPIRQGKADGTTPGIAPTNNPDVAGYGQTLNQQLAVQWNGWKQNPFQTAVLPGGCYAVSKTVFDDIGGFDHGFQVWGYEDVEISIKMWLFGYKCYAQPKVKILHLFRQAHPYRVTYDHIYYNMLRMAYSHFSEERIKKCKTLIKYGNPDHFTKMVLDDHALEQREIYMTRRKYSDDWFMEKFGIPF